MVKRGLLVSKRAGLTYSEIIFITLNLMFFAILVVFVGNSANGRPVYEQVYAKQIAFMIDEAKPDMEIYLDMKEPLSEFQKSKPLEAVSLDEEKKEVRVNFGSSGGHSFQYFTNSNIELDEKITEGEEGYKYLIIKVGEENDKK